MARDDYDVIVFKLLVYYYAILKRKEIFSRDIFDALTRGCDEQYVHQVLRLMQSEGLIEGLLFTRAWGSEYFLVGGDPSGAFITAEGVRYLKENSSMAKVKEFLRDKADAIITLWEMLF